MNVMLVLNENLELLTSIVVLSPNVISNRRNVNIPEYVECMFAVLFNIKDYFNLLSDKCIDVYLNHPNIITCFSYFISFPKPNNIFCVCVYTNVIIEYNDYSLSPSRIISLS